MKNRFNRLTSKEWLPFQKSWFRYSTDESLYQKNVRFFCKAEVSKEVVLYYGHKEKLFRKVCKESNLKFAPVDSNKKQSQFVLIDLRNEISEKTTRQEYEALKLKVINIIKVQFSLLDHRRFLSILIPNIQTQARYFPFAWDLALTVGTILSLKDEKIGCSEDENSLTQKENYFRPSKKVFYSLYFRKDENSPASYQEKKYNFFEANTQSINKASFKQSIPAWFILKPQPRKKNEVKHPAKYPEDLVEMFVEVFTNKNANVFDPMSGAGSTQLGSLKMERNGYGTELSTFFAEIANHRCKEYINPAQKEFFFKEKKQKFKILNKDARLINKEDFPEIDYVITSPPYWDMLNMKGAENQAKRIKKGLQTNYSDEPDDLGNIENYIEFLNILKEVYFNMAKIMKPGSYLTIVVKNIKKKGSNYPFAWDLANLLQEKFVLLPETFWCQDDISIAPYGYGNTFVTNTFHQYCLNFQIPINGNQS